MMRGDIQLITVTECARRLSLGRATAYQLIRSGDLPSVRIGRSLRVPVAALEALIAAQIAGPMQPDGQGDAERRR